LTSDSDILDAAHAEFMQHGNRATTQLIAARAGISEAGLLKRFGSKEKLLVQAMGRFIQHQVGFPAVPAAPVTQAALIGFGGEILRFFRQIIPAAVMCHAHLAAYALKELGPVPPPLVFRARVTEYFSGAVARGEIHVESPSILSAVFTGTLWQAAFFEHAFGDKELLGAGEAQFLSTLVATLWHGALPSVGTSAERSTEPPSARKLQSTPPKRGSPSKPRAKTSKVKGRDVGASTSKQRKS
jgi:AcrR family transcriptional regulator